MLLLLLLQPMTDHGVRVMVLRMNLLLTMRETHRILHLYTDGVGSSECLGPCRCHSSVRWHRGHERHTTHVNLTLRVRMCLWLLHEIGLLKLIRREHIALQSTLGKLSGIHMVGSHSPTSNTYGNRAAGMVPAKVQFTRKVACDGAQAFHVVTTSSNWHTWCAVHTGWRM